MIAQIGGHGYLELSQITEPISVKINDSFYKLEPKGSRLYISEIEGDCVLETATNLTVALEGSGEELSSPQPEPETPPSEEAPAEESDQQLSLAELEPEGPALDD